MPHAPRPTLTRLLPLCAALLSPSLALAEPPSSASENANEAVSTSTDDATSGVDDLEQFEELEELDELEELPFDRVDLAELEAAASAPREDRSAVELEPTMSPVGVEDPFPDRLDRPLPHEVWIPGAVGLGLAGASIVMSRLALRPDCSIQDDITTCTAPSSGDIGVRGGRVFGAVGFGAGGAVFGAVAGRSFSHWLAGNPRMSLAQKRRIAIGTGTTAVVLGSAGMIAGATLLGLSTQRAIDIGREFDGVDTNALTDEEHARLNQGLDQIRNARAGMMVLLSTPTLFATGVSMLAHRPRPNRLSLSPAFGRNYAGLTLRARF